MMQMNDMKNSGGGYPRAPIEQQPEGKATNQGYQPVPQQQAYGSPGQQLPYGQPGQQPAFGPPGPQPPYGPPESQLPYGPPGSQPSHGPPGSQQPYGAPWGQQPIVNQPISDQAKWMNAPTATANCPPGLEYLSVIDQLLVKQKIELMEAFTGFETNNKFTIKNSLGQKVYYAVEDNDWCTRSCCGPARPFDMKIFDNYRNEVIHLFRPLKCSLCCFPCCLQTIEVSAPPGNLLGTVEQEWTLCSPAYTIKNNLGDPVLRIQGPFCTMSCGGDVEFEVLTLNGEKVGKISKQWTGFAREMYTDADVFGITFPLDLDVRMKAVLMGACFLIDIMFFEK